MTSTHVGDTGALEAAIPDANKRQWRRRDCGANWYTRRTKKLTNHAALQVATGVDEEGVFAPEQAMWEPAASS